MKTVYLGMAAMVLWSVLAGGAVSAHERNYRPPHQGHHAPHHYRHQAHHNHRHSGYHGYYRSPVHHLPQHYAPRPDGRYRRAYAPAPYYHAAPRYYGHLDRH